MTIPFNKPAVPPNAEEYVRKVTLSGKLSGDHDFTRKCNLWIEKQTRTKKAFLTTSCTHALEMAALLIDIKEGDEVIMPSYTFPSTANAFILRGAKIAFVDIRPDTMNMDENLIEKAITKKTKAIVPVHYSGIGCEMDAIMALKEKYNLFVIEDAAQGIMAAYKGKSLGAIGDIGCYSFHETKNCQCGEGGAILLNNDKFIRRAEIIREKGTDRSSFFRGEVDRYSWQSIGSSYLPSELNAAFLYAQLEIAAKIVNDRLNSWNRYYENLKYLEETGDIELPKVPTCCNHNAHIFYIKVKDIDERIRILNHLKDNQINAFFHYVPLHSSKVGAIYGKFCGEDRFTTKESERLIRLPLYYQMSKDDIDIVYEKIESFFKEQNAPSSPRYGFQGHLSCEFPSQIIVDVTENCNLACIHCPHENFLKTEAYGGRNLDPELHKKLIDEIAVDGKGYCKYVRYTGLGETLLHPNILDMIEYAGRFSGVPINITTNGTLLTPYRTKRFLDAGVAVFDISIDANTNKTYALIRRKGDLDITRLNVLKLIALIHKHSYKAKVVTSFVEQPLNLHESDDFEKFWKDAGADFVVIRRLHSCAGSKEKIAAKMKSIINEQRKPCLYPWERLVLSPTGQVSFCPAEWKYQAEIAHLRDTTIKKIWRGKFMRKLREAHLKNDYSNHSFCGQCPDWSAVRWPHEGRAYSDMMEEFSKAASFGAESV